MQKIFVSPFNSLISLFIVARLFDSKTPDVNETIDLLLIHHDCIIFGSVSLHFQIGGDRLSPGEWHSLPLGRSSLSF